MATIIHDTFDGATGTPVGTTPDTVDNGNVWEVSANETATFARGSNRVNCTLAGGDVGNSNPVYIECGNANVQATASVYTKSGDGGNRRAVGPAFRVTDEGDLLAVTVSASEDTFRVIKYEGDAVTELASTSVSPLADGNYIIVAFVSVTTVFGALYDSSFTTLIGTVSATTSFNQSVTKHGMYFANGLANAYINDILIADAGDPYDLTSWAVSADGTTVTCTAWGLDYSGISGIESGKTASITAGGVSIPLSFVSAADGGGGNALLTFTAASNALTGETVTVDADVGLVNDGTNGSNAIVAGDVTNSSTQSPETGVSVASMSLLDSDTVRITITATATAWGTVTSDTNDVSVWAVSGRGHPTVSTITVGGEGTKTITVDLNLSRTPYSDETFDIETRTGWITDDRGNTAEVSWSLTGQTRLDLSGGASPLATATTFSNGRTSITISAAKAVSFYLDGVPAIVVPTGTVDIVSETPARATAGGGEAIHGAMLNPLAAGSHSYDERSGTYSGVLLPSLSATVDAGDSYIKASSESDADSTTIDGASVSHPTYVRSYGVYHFVASAPSATEVSPPAIGYNGTGRPTLSIDLDAIYAALPAKSLSAVSGTVPVLNSWISRFCQSNIGGYINRNGNNRPLVSTYYTTAEGYGQNQSATVANACIHMMGDEATEAEKKFLAVWLCHHGVQMFYLSKVSGSKLVADGGNNQAYGAAMVAALHWTGNDAAIADLRDEGHGNEFAQTFAWSQDDIDRYNNTHASTSPNASQSYMRYEHTIAVGGVSGNTITLTTGLNNKFFETGFTGLRITNGTQTAIITSHTRYDEFFDVDDATGFAAGQTVTLEGYDTLPSIGTPGWGITHTVDPSRTWYMGLQTYQGLNDWSMAVMFVQFLGAATGLANDPWIREAVEVNADLAYLGAIDNDGVDRHESAYAGNFWDAYEADALAATAPSIGTLDPARRGNRKPRAWRGR